MTRKSNRKRSAPREEEDSDETNTHLPSANDDEEDNSAKGSGNSIPSRRVVRPAVPAHVREWQRHVAEREAARLARPESHPVATLAHASRKKSSVCSTPSGSIRIATDQGRSAGGLSSSLMSSTSELPTGATVTQWCGPFAVAREMIAARQEAKRQREIEMEAENQINHPLDDLMQEIEKEQRRKAHPALRWKSHAQVNAINEKKSIYSKRQNRVDIANIGSKTRVPTLFDSVIRFLVDQFDDVERLGDVDHEIRSSIARELVARQKLNPTTLSSLLESDLEALELIDCSLIPQDDLLKVLERLMPTLRYLILDMCGRCVGPKAVDAMQNNHLLALSIGGAYLLKDGEAARLVETSQFLTSLEFKACPLLGDEFCRAMVKTRVMSPFVDLSLEDVPLDKSHFVILASSSTAWTSLQSLSVRRIDVVTDDIIASFLKNVANNGANRLRFLDISHNHHLTDCTLACIRKYADGIRSLNLNGLALLTSAGLEALFMPVPGSTVEHPPALESLEVAHLHHLAVTDDVIQLICQASSLQGDGGEGVTLNSSAIGDDGVGVDSSGNVHRSRSNSGIAGPCWHGLLRLDVQGSSVITFASCESLVRTCAYSLETLNFSFCTNINDQGLGYLVQHCRRLQKLEIWGCAQITDVFLDGHDRVFDSSLEIAGSWLKKNSSKITSQ